jgi:hypothetical protein
VGWDELAPVEKLPFHVVRVAVNVTEHLRSQPPAHQLEGAHWHQTDEGPPRKLHAWKN